MRYYVSPPTGRPQLATNDPELAKLREKARLRQQRYMARKRTKEMAREMRRIKRWEEWRAEHWKDRLVV